MTKKLLKRVNEEHQRDWPDHLPAVLLAHRTAPQESSRFSPFFLLYGRDPTLPMDTLLRPKLKYHGEDWTTIQLGRMHEAFMLVKKNTADARERQKRLYDRKTKPVKLEVGQAVWYYYPVVQEGVPAKIQQKWLPHYRIVSFKSDVAALIRHQPTGETRTVHVNQLCPALIDEAWEKDYDGPEPLANRNLVNPKRIAYEKEQEKNRNKKTKEAKQATRLQPTRACRVMVPPGITGAGNEAPDQPDQKVDEPRHLADDPVQDAPRVNPAAPNPADPTMTARRTIPWKRRMEPIQQPTEDCIAKRTRLQGIKRPLHDNTQEPTPKQGRSQAAKRHLAEEDKQDDSETESKLPKLEEDSNQEVKDEDPMDVESSSEEEFMDTVDNIVYMYSSDDL